MFEFAYVGIASGGETLRASSAWGNISGVSPASNTARTITGSGPLTAVISGYSSTGGNQTLRLYVNGALVSTLTASGGAILTYSVADGDSVYFLATKGADGSGTSASWTVTTNAGVAPFTVSVSSPP